MGGKRVFGIAISMAAVMALSGCGSTFPELTEDQYKQTVEYAAGLLMRYSNNGQERLIYVDAKELEKQRRKEAEKAADESATTSEPAKQTTPVQPAPQPATPVAVETDPENTTPEDNFDPESMAAETEATTAPAEEVAEAEESSEDTAAADPNAITLSAEESQEITDDIFLSYQGYMITSTYPESSKSYVVNADKGKKLLVLRFDLYNAANESKKVNMIPLNLLFEILLNGKNIGYSSVTFLPNDLSSYSGTIDSKAHESVVVLTQIDEKQSGHIDSLGMISSIRGQKQTVNLK